MKKFIVLFLCYSILSGMGQGNEKDFEFVDTIRTLQGDLFNGHYKTYYSNGKVKTYSFLKNGLIDSFVYFYSKNGTLSSAIIKTKDTTHQLKYNSKGQILNETLLKNDSIFMFKVYFTDKFNSIKTIYRYKNGSLQGRLHTFFVKENKTDVSAIFSETIYINGLKNGIECFYTKKGLPSVATCYSMDTFCYRVFYNKLGVRTSVEVNTGNKKSKKKGIPESICSCDNLFYKE